MVDLSLRSSRLFEVRNLGEVLPTLGYPPTEGGYERLRSDFKSLDGQRNLFSKTDTLRDFGKMMSRFNDRLEPPSGRLVYQHMRREVFLKYSTGGYIAGMVYVMGVEKGIFAHGDGNVEAAINKLIVKHTFCVDGLREACRDMAKKRNGHADGHGDWVGVVAEIAGAAKLHNDVVQMVANRYRTREDVCNRINEAAKEVCGPGISTMVHDQAHLKRFRKRRGFEAIPARLLPPLPE